jgi:MSHA pilin protein MshA
LEADFMGKATQRGFTLIELVVVIVILGILSAFAVPRFMGLEGKAREAAVNGLAGSVRSAAALAHSMYLATGTSPPSLTIEGKTITFSNGYPDVATISNTLQDFSGFDGTTTPGTFTKTGAGTPATCSVVYGAATSSLPPTITVATGGCP